MIPYGKQLIEEDDIEAVIAALKSDFLTCGPEIEAFEREFAEFVGAKHAVAVCNATAALHLAMKVAEISQGDRVVTSPNTFLASANCAAYVGATPDFCDIDPISYNLCPEKLEADWKPDTKAVVAVDYGGQPANLPMIKRVAQERGAIVIEDGCHGVGGGFWRKGKYYPIGGHPWADMTTFSFHPVKTMTTGEGGVLVTNNDEYAEKARLLRTHGMQRDSSMFAGLGAEGSVEKGPWVYEMEDLGYNYRITDLQCALGRSQLRKLKGFIKRRLEIVSRYNQAFRDLSWLQIPSLGAAREPSEFVLKEQSISWHLYTTQIDFPALNKSREEVMNHLREHGIGSQVLYIPVHFQPWYRRQYGYGRGKCPIAESFYERALSLPLYPAMSNEDVEKVVTVVKNLQNV